MMVAARSVDRDGDTVVQFSDGTTLAIILSAQFAAVFLPKDDEPPPRVRATAVLSPQPSGPTLVFDRVLANV